MDKMTIDGRRVEVARTTAERILALRRSELRPGLSIDSARFEGDENPATRHFGAFLGGRVIGCASMMPEIWNDEPAYRLRGMAVRADLARLGVGGVLLGFAERMVAGEFGVPWLWCNARLPAVPFYGKHGWGVASDRFEVPGVGPHHRMYKNVRGKLRNEPRGE